MRAALGATVWLGSGVKHYKLRLGVRVRVRVRVRLRLRLRVRG